MIVPTQKDNIFYAIFGFMRLIFRDSGLLTAKNIGYFFLTNIPILPQCG